MKGSYLYTRSTTGVQKMDAMATTTMLMDSVREHWTGNHSKFQIKVHPQQKYTHTACASLILINNSNISNIPLSSIV